MQASDTGESATTIDEHHENDSSRTTVSGLPTLAGWRLWMVVSLFCIGLLLSGLESTIVATALVTIASDLGDFEKSNWVVESFLLTYTGFLILYSRVSDIFGRKTAMLIGVSFFTVGSLACGLAQTMNQLIIFRAFQGLGGSGLYSLGLSSLPEVTPAKHLGVASALASIASVCASVLGPVIGGAVTSNTTWRWVFWFNIPGGIALIALVIFFFPGNSPKEAQSTTLYAKIDWPGMVLSLAASVLIVYGLEGGGSQYEWKSAKIIAPIVASGFCWLAFGYWEHLLTSKDEKTSKLPVFPTSLIGHRVIGFAFLSAALSGFPFMVTLINLPQRFQIVNALSPVAAGIRLLPLLVLSAFGAGLSGIICNKKNISFYMICFANTLQVIGTGLMSVSSTAQQIPASIYGLEAILGFAFGTNAVCLMITSRVEVDEKHSAVAIGAMTQVRVFGGIIGLAICQTVLLSHLKSRLFQYLTQQQLADILVSAARISLLPPEISQMTRHVYGEAANVQMRIAMGVSMASFVAGLFIWRRHIIEFSQIAEKKSAIVTESELQSR